MPAWALGLLPARSPLGEELAIRHARGNFGKWLIQLAKTDVLLLGDWGMIALDATIADAILDRIMPRHHRITLKGESLRKTREKQKRRVRCQAERERFG